VHINLSHPAFHCLASRSLACALRGKRGALSRAFESLIAGAGPYDRIPAHVCNRDNRVVKRCLDVRDSALNHPAFFFLPLLYTHANSFDSCRGLCLCSGRGPWLAAYARPAAFAGSGIRFCPLSANRQSFAVTQAAICTGINKPLDVQRHFLAKVSLDSMIAVDNFPHFDNLIFAKILDADSAIDTGFFQDLPGSSPSDAVDVRQPDVSTLIPRQIDASNTCHNSLLILSYRIE